MYDQMNQAKLKEAASLQKAQGAIVGGYAIQPPTVRENIDQQIEVHEAAIRRLNETKTRLGAANLLDIKISDLREAMSY